MLLVGNQFLFDFPKFIQKPDILGLVLLFNRTNIEAPDNELEGKALIGKNIRETQKSNFGSDRVSEFMKLGEELTKVVFKGLEKAKYRFAKSLDDRVICKLVDAIGLFFNILQVITHFNNF